MCFQSLFKVFLGDVFGSAGWAASVGPSEPDHFRKLFFANRSHLVSHWLKDDFPHPGSYHERRSASCPVNASVAPLTESFADVGHGLEDAVREVDLDLHVLHVGQLEAQQLVLRREEQPGVGLDAVLVQRPVGLQQPRLLLLPPQSMVGPILLHICGGERNTWSG